MIQRDVPHIVRDGKRIDLTEEEARAVYRQLERERIVGYVFDMLRLMEIEPSKEVPLEAYVQAYRIGEDKYPPPYISDDDLDYYGEVFRDEEKMADYATRADPQDGYMYWHDPTRSGYEPPPDGGSWD